MYACQHCQVAKNPTAVATKCHVIKAEEPWTVVTLDLMGPFDATNRNHSYIILLTDVFTKWIVVLPLHDLSAAEVARAIANASFSYGSPQKVAIDQGEDFVHQVNCELFKLFGTKELIIPYTQTNRANETGETIRSFLHQYCMEHGKDWDDHLPAVAYAFNLIHLETEQNTPFFQMFNRNPYIPSSLSVIQKGKDDSMFARIQIAIKEAETALQERTASRCQNLKTMSVERQKGHKVHEKKKPKQLNQSLLKVGHEVLRQKKNWWKDGHFQSEWVGPCIIDYITDNDCAILRDVSGSRLKRPIKISHLKPYVRGSREQDSSYNWQSAVVVDHDYVGSSEASTERDLQEMFSAKAPKPAPDDALLKRNHVLAECKSGPQPEFTNPDFAELVPPNPEHWPAAYWTLQNKMEVT